MRSIMLVHNGVYLLGSRCKMILIVTSPYMCTMFGHMHYVWPHMVMLYPAIHGMFDYMYHLHIQSHVPYLAICIMSSHMQHIQLCATCQAICTISDHMCHIGPYVLCSSVCYSAKLTSTLFIMCPLTSLIIFSLTIYLLGLCLNFVTFGWFVFILS